MERYTKKTTDHYEINAEQYDEAINKLGTFEDIIDELISKQAELSKELKELRGKQETKSFRFRQLLGNKLTNSALITIFERHGLMDRETDLD